MTKEQRQVIKEVTETLKYHDYHIIKPSIFFNEDSTSDISFYAYDKFGDVFHFFINFAHRVALKQTLSIVCVHDSDKITHWFF